MLVLTKSPFICCFFSAFFACNGSSLLWGPGSTWPWTDRPDIWGCEKSAEAAKCKSHPFMSAMFIESLVVWFEGQMAHISDGFCPLQVRDGDLVCVRELVRKCLAEYATTKCFKPHCLRLRWTISGRTARQLKHSYYKIAHLPTIPESAC